MTRYRIQDDLGRIWDAENKRWTSISDGDYNTYGSVALGVAAAGRTKASRFVTAGGVRVVENTPPSEWV